MTRAKWKGPFINLKYAEIFKKKPNLIIANRNSEIVPKFLGQTFKIYNGKTYSEIEITEEMLGHEVGEFVFTRKKFSFTKKKSTKKSK